MKTLERLEDMKSRGSAKSNVIIVDINKVDRLAVEIKDTINEHLCHEYMIGAEIALAINKACYTVIEAWLETQK